MCLNESADTHPNQANMVEVPLTQRSNDAHSEGRRGTSSSLRAEMERQKLNPYAPRASDFLSNISNFNIIESTLRGICSPFHMIARPFKKKLFDRGRAICQCFLRYEDKDRNRQGPRRIRCWIHWAYITSSFWAISPRLWSNLQAGFAGKDPHPHPLSHGRRAYCCRDRFDSWSIFTAAGAYHFH